MDSDRRVTNRKERAKAEFEDLMKLYKEEHDTQDVHIKADFILVKYTDPEIAYLYTKFKTEIGGFWYA